MRIRTDVNLIEFSRVMRETLDAFTPLRCTCGRILAYSMGDWILLRITPKKSEFFYPTSGQYAIRCTCSLWAHGDTTDGWFSPGSLTRRLSHEERWPDSQAAEMRAARRAAYIPKAERQQLAKEKETQRVLDDLRHRE